MPLFAKRRATETPRQAEGVLILHRGDWSDSLTQQLVEKIVEMLRSRGHSVAPDFKVSVMAAGDSLDDSAFADTALRQNFPQRGKHDLPERVEMYEFRGEIHSGNWFVVFDSPA